MDYKRMGKKIMGYGLLFLLVVVAVVIWWRFYFVYSEGTKAGVLNTFQHKGVVFKTYEGKIIQSGFRANVQSNEFDFSVEDERIAQKLMENAGKEMELHYKRYFGTLPWRGSSVYVVDSIYKIFGKAPEESTIRAK
jgi:hypothetical protein